MVRARLCLLASLMIHTLVAISARYVVLSPIREFSSHSVKLRKDALKVVVIDKGMLLRETEVKRGPETVLVQKTEIERPVPAAPPLDLIRASLRKRIQATDRPREEITVISLPVPSLVTSQVVPELKAKLRKTVEAHGAPRAVRSVFIGCIDYITYAYKDALKKKVQDFFEALMHGDFESASVIAGPGYQRVKWKKTPYADVIEIISIGEPCLQFCIGYRAVVCVSCQMKLSSGQMIRRKILIVMPCYASEEGWSFDYPINVPARNPY